VLFGDSSAKITHFSTAHSKWVDKIEQKGMCTCYELENKEISKYL
jgi:hypothetical protein